MRRGRPASRSFARRARWGSRSRSLRPGKSARPPAARVKTDRRDAELLARLCHAGQLRPIAVPSEFVEAARHLARAREQVRGDLLRSRHRVSKLLLQHGRVYPERTRWNQRHRRWLGCQRFEQAPTELAFIDMLAAVDGLVARKEALDERLSRLATDERLWPTVTRRHAFPGINTLTRDRSDAAQPPAGAARPPAPDCLARPAPPAPPPSPPTRAGKAGQRRNRRDRARALGLPLGRSHHT